MAEDDLNAQKPERCQRLALPSRSRSFLKATPHTPEEEAEVKQEEEAKVSKAHEAVVVDLQAWQARGLMERNDKAWAGDNLVVGALLLAVLFLWPVALMAWVEPWGALTLTLTL